MAAPVGEARQREACRPSWGLVVCAKGSGILCGVEASLSEGCAGLVQLAECPPWLGLGALQALKASATDRGGRAVTH